MNDIIESYENKCDVCIHRVNAYCKAYKFPIKQLEISKCKRRKIRSKKNGIKFPFNIKKRN